MGNRRVTNHEKDLCLKTGPTLNPEEPRPVKNFAILCCILRKDPKHPDSQKLRHTEDVRLVLSSERTVKTHRCPLNDLERRSDSTGRNRPLFMDEVVSIPDFLLRVFLESRPPTGYLSPHK